MIKIILYPIFKFLRKASHEKDTRTNSSVLATIFLFFLINQCKANQSDFPFDNLPQCPNNVNAYWDNCIGNARRYEGSWKNNKFNGQGKLFDSSGNLVYEGEFKDDHFHGNGFLYMNKTPSLMGCQSNSGSCPQPKYIGQFQSGVYHGRGRLLNNFGESYIGEFQKKLYHGQGIRIDKNGDKYIGEFQVGVPHGRGSLIKLNGKIIEGVWQNGTHTKNEKINSPETEKNILKYFSQDEILNWSHQINEFAKYYPSKIDDGSKSELNIEESINESKNKCRDLGFKEGSEKFGTCVLKLSK